LQATIPATIIAEFTGSSIKDETWLRPDTLEDVTDEPCETAKFILLICLAVL
jgi:hypothetical protein